MSRAKRPDRYCTRKNAPLVHQYMVERADKIATLFKIRGVHRNTFKKHLSELTAANGPDALYRDLHELCCRWDKSEAEDFKSYKARVRRYLHAKRLDRAIYVSEATRLALESFAQEEGLHGMDEAIEQLIRIWKINNIDIQEG